MPPSHVICRNQMAGGGILHTQKRCAMVYWGNSCVVFEFWSILPIYWSILPIFVLQITENQVVPEFSIKFGGVIG